MKKYFFYSFCIALLGPFMASAQPNETSPTKFLTDGSGERVFKVYNNPLQDKTDQFDIQGLGGTTFTASNTSDGTKDSYRHSLQIVLTLIPANKAGNNNFRLIFYSPNDNIQQAAAYSDGTLSIYFPEAVYEDIKSKLEQAFAARKKVAVKVIQKPDGYREGTLIL
jgi:hypothetical protein